MSLSAEIRGILTAGPKTIIAIAELVGEPSKKVQKLMYQLKFLGKVKYAVDEDGHNLYSIAKWPEREPKNAPPPRAARGKGRGKKASRARATEAPATPAAAVANGNGTADQFSITDQGVLAIKQSDSVIHLHPDSFTRLRTFIERAEQIFNPAE